ncbi:inclusion body family protein [Aquimarina rhabdastrellae]
MSTKTEVLEDTLDYAALSGITNLQTVIDTSKVIRDFKNPSKDKNRPTAINPSGYMYMVVSDNQAISGQGTININFNASVGDVVRMSAVSEFNNFENPVVLYNVAKLSGDDVFSSFISRSFETKTPIPNKPNPLPPLFENRTFSFYQADVEKVGSQNFTIWFALYERRRGGNPELYGYFKWDPKITVS